MKFLQRLVIVILVSTFICGLISFFVPKLYKSQIKKEIIYLIDKNIVANVAFTDFNLSVFKQFPNISIELKDFVITGKDEFLSDTLVYFPKLELTMNLKRYVFDHEIHISEISLESPYINILKLPDGTANYDITKKDSLKSDTGSFYLDIDKVKISNGKIHWIDKKNRLQFTIDHLNHTAKWDIEKTVFDWETHTKIDEFTLDYQGVKYLNKKETELDIIMEVDTEKSLLTFKENNIRINHFNFNFEGAVGINRKEYSLDIKFSAKETLFKHLLSILPGVIMKDLKQLKTNGDLAFDGFVKGIYSDSTGKLPSYHLNLQVRDAMVQFDSLPLPAKNINFHLVADNPDGIKDHLTLDLKSFSLKIDKNNINGFVKMQGLNPSRIQGEMISSIDLEDIKDVFPMQGLTVSGMASLQLKVSGTYHKALRLFPNVNALFQLKDGYLLSKNHPEPLKEIHIIAKMNNSTGRIEDSRAEIERLTFNLEDEPFDIRGVVSDFENYAYDFEVKGKIDLAKLTRIYPLEGLNLSGIVNTDIKSKGKAFDLENGKYEKTVTEGKIEFSNFHASGSKLFQPIQIDTAYLQFSPTKINLTKLEGYIGKSDVKISGELTNYMAFLTTSNDLITGNVNLESDSLLLNEWMTNNNTPKQDSASRIQIIEVPKNLNFIFDSDIHYLQFDDMHITDMKGEVKVKDGALSLNETGFNSLNAKFKLNGDYNTVNIKKPFFDFNLNIQELDINKAYREIKLIQQLAPAAKDAYGTISIDYKLKANLTKDMEPIFETMEGGGSIRIHEAKIDGMKIMDEISQQSQKGKMTNGTVKDFVMESEIKGSQLIVKPFTMKLSDFHTEVQGINDISGKIDYLVKVSLIPFEGIKLPFHITGTYNKPKISLGKRKQP